MSRIRVIFSAYLLIGLSIFGLAAQEGHAQQSGRSEREVRGILRDLNAKIDDFRYKLSYEPNDNFGDKLRLERDLRTLNDKVRDFENKFNNRRENAADVSTVLDAARSVDETVNQNRLSGKIAGDWTGIRASLEQLAASYNVSFQQDSNGNNNSAYSDANNNRYPSNNQPPNNYPAATNSYNYALTGTYRLDASRSENAGDIAARAIENSGARVDSQAKQDLENKLAAPQEISIDARGNQITIASSGAAQITFTADGRDRSEQTSDGRAIRVRSTLRGQELTVSSLGGDTDYTVVFAPADNGKSMRVTRRITTDYLNQTVFAESFYLKTDSTARLGSGSDSNDANGSYSSSDSNDNNHPASNNYPNNSGGYPTARNGRAGSFVVPNGTILTGTLQNDISTKYSQNNDRFRMTVNAPNEFRGAVLEGYVSGLSRSGKVSGRSQLTFNFETIRLSNGQTYDFAGFLQNVTDADGNTVKVDTEGTAKGDSQTKETVKRGGIGAGIGAVIGAIAGGAQGAAIGAVIGGGAGAGSVVVQGKDDLELKKGSAIAVQSSAPSR